MKRTPRRKIIKELRGQGITYNQIRRFDYLMKKIEDTANRMSQNYVRLGQYRELRPLDLEDVPAFLNSGATFEDILRIFGEDNRDYNEKLRWAQQTANYINDLIGTNVYNAGDFINFNNEEIEELQNIIDELEHYVNLRDQADEGSFEYMLYSSSIDKATYRLDKLIYSSSEG